MDLLKTLEQEELVQISNDFNYLRATEKFVGLKLLPMARTENMRVAIYNLLNGADIPVVALVHALDSEARIGEREDYVINKLELFQIKEKINQGEELRKKIKDLGLVLNEDNTIIELYNDIANQISKVLAGFERRACELLSTGRLTLKENGVDKVVDYNFNTTENKIDVTGWSDTEHDIFGDLASLKKASGNKIVRQIISSKVLGYMMANKKFVEYSTKNALIPTEDLLKTYVENQLKIEIVVDDRTYRLSRKDKKQYRFFDEDTIISLTTRGEVGKTFMTSTTIEDANMGSTYGLIAVDQWTTKDPHTTWTMAEGIGLPVIADINNTLYLTKVTA